MGWFSDDEDDEDDLDTRPDRIDVPPRVDWLGQSVLDKDKSGLYFHGICYFGDDECTRCGARLTSKRVPLAPPGMLYSDYGQPYFCSEDCRFKALDSDFRFDEGFLTMGNAGAINAHETRNKKLKELRAMYKDDRIKGHGRGSDYFDDLIKEAETDYHKFKRDELIFPKKRMEFFSENYRQRRVENEVELQKKAEAHQQRLDEARREREHTMMQEGREDRIRSEHTHILGGTGAGKTTLIQHLILEDLKQDDPPPMVVIDPKGDMIDRISRLEVFNPYNGRLRHRLIIIDPKGTPPLNIFAAPTDPEQRAAAINQLLELFGYIFSTSNTRLTARQSVPFSFVARLVFDMGGNLDTMMDILSDKSKTYEQQIATFTTDAGARRFFQTDFYSTGFSETRGHVRARIYDIMQRPQIYSMLNTETSCIDMLDCLLDSKIVLINTAMPLLGIAGSQMLGRYFISQTLNAAFRRKRTVRRFAHLIIDEFQDYVDEEKTPYLLRMAREYNLGVTIAHQNMYCDEMNDNIRNSITTNTQTKYGSRLRGMEVTHAASEFGCSRELIQSAYPTKTHARFVYSVSSVTPEPFIIEIPFGEISQEPQMSEEAHQLLLKRNHAKLKGEVVDDLPIPSLPSPAEPLEQTTKQDDYKLVLAPRSPKPVKKTFLQRLFEPAPRPAPSPTKAQPVERPAPQQTKAVEPPKQKTPEPQPKQIAPKPKPDDEPESKSTW